MIIENITTAIVFVTVCMPFLAVTLWAIVDAAGREFPTFNQKLVWMLVASVPFLGFIAYLIFGRWRGKKEGAES